jgi:dUTP pyrophosphatase
MSDPLVLKVKRLRPDAKLPTKAHETDAAWDLFAVAADHDGGGPVRQVPTGIAIELPPGWYAQLRCRSSQAALGFDVRGGVIDPSYRGEWIVNLAIPSSAAPFLYGGLAPGDRVCQFVLIRVPSAVAVEVDELSPSERGDRGFGSTGA